MLKAAQEILDLATPDEGKELTDAQQDKLFSKCEATIGAHAGGFVAVGVALEAIRRNGLHKLAGSKSFEDYCEDRWGFGRARAAQLIKAAKTVNNCKQAALLRRLTRARPASWASSSRNSKSPSGRPS